MDKRHPNKTILTYWCERQFAIVILFFVFYNSSALKLSLSALFFSGFLVLYFYFILKTLPSNMYIPEILQHVMIICDVLLILLVILKNTNSTAQFYNFLTWLFVHTCYIFSRYITKLMYDLVEQI